MMRLLGHAAHGSNDPQRERESKPRRPLNYSQPGSELGLAAGQGTMIMNGNKVVCSLLG